MHRPRCSIAAAARLALAWMTSAAAAWSLSAFSALSALSAFGAEPPSLAGAARQAQVRAVIGQSSLSGRPHKLDATAQARYDYLLHCSGCHAADGVPNELGRIPPLRDRIGRFLHLPEGRAYLVQVPGVNNSGLNDAAIARVMNWLLPAFADATVPADFVPYSAAEVARLRAQRPVDIPAFRKGLARRLADAGYPVDY